MNNFHCGAPKSGAWLLEASEHVAPRTAMPAAVPKPPKSDSPWMDAHGWTQDRLNANALSHWDAASPQTQAEAHHWYPAAHDWADEMSSRNGWHPDKGYATVAAFSPLRRWDGNLQDAHNFMTHYPHSPENLKRPSGLSSGENTKRAQRVYDAPDDPAAIRQALWGKAGEKGAKKITNFHDNMRDPSDPNPVTIDSWMPRGILWGHGEEPNWPDDLNKGLPITKKQNPETGAWESPGVRPPTPRDIGLQALGKAGAYDRMANAVRHVAQQRGLPAAHVAQAGIWNKLGGTANPDGDQVPQHPFGPMTHIQDPHALYQEVWGRQKAPKSAGFHYATDSGFEIDDYRDDADGAMKAIDIAFAHGDVPHTEMLQAVPPLAQHEQQRLGPHPHQAAVEKSWYTTAPMAPKKPRRPNAPRYGPTRPKHASSWYVTADMDVDGKDPDAMPAEQQVSSGGQVGTPLGYASDSATDPHAPSYDSMFPQPHVTPAPIGGGGGHGGGAPVSEGGGGGSAVGGNPAGGPPSQSLSEALTRAGIDPSMHPLISGFSKAEGNNPSGAPTLGFTDSQAGSTLDQHAQALAKQLQDRQSVSGPFPSGGSPHDQASWMATVVGQSGSPSDWQGHAQPARSDYVNRVVNGMPSPTPAPTAPTAGL